MSVDYRSTASQITSIPAVPPTPQFMQARPMSSAITTRRPFVLANTIAAGIGALLMLVSLALPFYTLRAGESSVNVSASHLLTSNTDWAGTGLPLFLIIIFACVVLLSLILDLLTKSAIKPLWSTLGMLCIFSVICNACYILWHVHSTTGTWATIVAPRCALASGALWW